MASRSQRTEKPTAKRLDDERKKGNVPRTKELGGALGLLGLLVFGHLFGREWVNDLEGLIGGSLAQAQRSDLTLNDALNVLMAVGTATASLLLLPLGVIATASLGGSLVQGPPPFTFRPLTPDLSKINPFKGIKKVFRLKGWVEMLKTALKMALFTAVALEAVHETLTYGLTGAPGPHGTFWALMTLGGKVILRVSLLALVLAFVDWLFTRYDHTRQLRMTKQEVKDERRQHEGDPLVRARVKSKQLALARSRMMADVSKATVVVTNPTHYAIALRYLPGESDVPQVVAKGRGKIAERIRELAAEHRIPIISDPPLARALFRLVGVGGYIPEKLYKAVAEILALVMRRREARR